MGLWVQSYLADLKQSSYLGRATATNSQTHLTQQCPDMLLLITQGIIAYTILWGCWRILRPLVVKTDIDNLPGPASDSFLKGDCRYVLACTHFVVNSCSQETLCKCLMLMLGRFTRSLGRSVCHVFPTEHRHSFISYKMVGWLELVPPWVYELARGAPRCAEYLLRISCSMFPIQRLCIIS